jgi:chloramphenicol-sensitive protein RarD
MRQEIEETVKRHKQGVIYTTVAFVAWGVLPFYWKILDFVPAVQILAHRIIWSFVFISIILVIRKKVLPAKTAMQVEGRKRLLLPSILIGINWFTYVYAVNSDRLVEASMGYYINPLLSVILGIVVLKERLNMLQIVAFLIACTGVLYLTIDYGKFPWIAVLLACAFALYGLFKKTTKVEPMPGLMLETLYLSPIALGIIFYGMIMGRGALFRISIGTDLFLIVAGVVTVMPLYWFAEGARRIPLSSVGFLQYIAPTLMLFIGIFVFREPFTGAHLVSFGLVWLALALYSLTLIGISRRARGNAGAA